MELQNHETLANSSPLELIFAPIEPLPDDVLGIIFEFAASGDVIHFKAIGGFDLAFVFTISHVSRAWRRTVTSLPFLWNHVSVCVGRPEYSYSGISPSRATAKSLLKCLDYILGMSRTCPLELELIASHGSGGLKHPFIFLPRVAAHGHRWRTVTLDMTLVSFLPPKAPALQSLTLNNYPCLSEINSFYNFVRHAPQLRELRYSGSYHAPVAYPLPWAQLDSLSGVSNMSWLADVAPFLSQLQTLAIENPYTSFAQVSDPLPMDFPLVHTFTFRGMADQEILTLANLHFPSLHTLFLDIPYMTARRFSLLLRALEVLISESSPVVRTLTIRIGATSFEEGTSIRALLTLFPDLESLDWSFDIDTQSLFKLLSETLPLPAPTGELEFRYLPHLSSLKVNRLLKRRWVQNWNEMLDSMLEALEMRTDPTLSAAVLRRFDVTSHNGARDIIWDQERWERIKGHGVALTVQNEL